MIHLILLLALGNPRSLPNEQFDMMELNHFRSQYSQVILYNWSHDYQRYDVEAWYLVEQPESYPTRTNGRFEARYQNKHITAKYFIETWTNYDRERKQSALKHHTYRDGWRCER